MVDLGYTQKLIGLGYNYNNYEGCFFALTAYATTASPKYGYEVFNKGIYNFFFLFWAHYSIVNDMQKLSTNNFLQINWNSITLYKEKPTTGFKPGCLYLIYISQQFSSTNSFSNLSSFILDDSTYFCNFDALACSISCISYYSWY